MSMTEPEPTAAVKTPVPSEYAFRVLLVDDQAMIGEAIRRALLQEPSIEFHYCSNPADALALAEKIKPTVILQDLVMPGVDGLTLVRRYRAGAATKDIPVVVLSTKEEPAIKSEAFAAGASDYLVKLPDKIELIARIRHHSKAYMNQLQRDEAYLALRASQQQLMEKNIELQRLTNVDGLTGLSNRRYFDEYLEVEWLRGARQQQPLSLLMIDVDHFKRYNDTYGHVGGDGVLKRIAEALQEIARRPADVAARFGGEEFALIMPSTPLAGMQVQAEDFCRRVEELKIPHSASTTSPYVTVSVGGASMFTHGTGPFSKLIAAADAALYEAKRAGRNRAVLQGPAPT